MSSSSHLAGVNYSAYWLSMIEYEKEAALSTIADDEVERYYKASIPFDRQNNAMQRMPGLLSSIPWIQILMDDELNWIDRTKVNKEGMNVVDQKLLNDGLCDLMKKYSLNASQVRAIHAAIYHHVSLVEGPPGTGKTKTAVAMLAHHAKVLNTPVLATGPSNVAADNLLEYAVSTKYDGKIRRYGK